MGVFPDHQLSQVTFCKGYQIPLDDLCCLFVYSLTRC